VYPIKAKKDSPYLVYSLLLINKARCVKQEFTKIETDWTRYYRVPVTGASDHPHPNSDKNRTPLLLMRASSDCPLCTEDYVNPIWAVNPNSRKASKPNMRVLDWTKVRVAFTGEEGAAPSLPGRMGMLTTSVVDSCSVKITWEPPFYDGGARITSYKVEVKAFDNSWQLLSILCDAAVEARSTTCLIKMDKLKLAPYKLRSNQAILTRAAAVNEVGTGPVSEVNNSARDSAAKMTKDPPNFK
jgi:hypothetical protein